MAKVRELVAQLGFKVDTTPATRFNAAVKRSRNELEALNKVRLTGLKGGLLGFFSSSGFRSGIVTAFKGIGIAAGAALAVGLKASSTTNEINQALAGLKNKLFKAPEQFKLVEKSISGILSDDTLKRFTNKFELITAITKAFEKSSDISEILKNIPTAIKLATITPGADLSELLTGFAEVRATGDVGLLKELGIFTNQFLQILQRTQTAPTDLGQLAVTEIFNRKIGEMTGSLDKNFEAFTKINSRSEELFNSFKQLLDALGEAGALKIIRELNTQLIALLETIKDIVKGVKTPSGVVNTLFEPSEGRLKEVQEERKIAKDRVKSVGIFFDDFFEFISPNLGRANLALQGINRSNTPGNSQTITNNNGGGIKVDVTVQPGANGDAGQIKSAVMDAISRANGATKDIAGQTTKIRGGQ